MRAPAHHRVTTMRHIVLRLERVGGVDLVGEVGEREEVQPADDDLEALIVDHRPMALGITGSLRDVRALERHHKLLGLVAVWWWLANSVIEFPTHSVGLQRKEACSMTS